MANYDTQTVIIGAGPAGISAALEAAKNGVQVTLIDEGKKIGGQFYKQFPDGFSVDKNYLDKKFLDKNYFEGKKFIDQVKDASKNIKIIENALVWGIYPDNEVVFIKDNKSNSIKCKKLILAEGAYERSIPFPGWTLPGVYTTGGAQTILHTYRVVPGSKVLLSGTGPIQLVLANNLIRAGVEVVAVLESASVIDSFKNMKLKYIPSVVRQFDLIKDGLSYLNGIRKKTIPYLRSHAVIEARGTNKVNSAIYAQLDSNWKPIPGTEKEVFVDAICLGYGFISSTRLSHISGCEHEYDRTLGCFIPKHDNYMESSVSGVFVAGDSAGVAGHLVAIEEGHLAGIRACRQLDTINQKEEQRLTAPIFKKLKSLRCFEAALNEACAIRAGLYHRITDDTIVCRCEEITAGEIRNTVSFNRNIDVNELKKITRAGMGFCQGRSCGATIAALVALEKNIPIEEMGFINYQEPAKPIRWGDMVAE
jgi:thioredoxin reductase